MNHGPTASVIIPAHNEARVIARTLQTLLASSGCHEFDVIVVCNGCSDSTQDVAASLLHPDIRVIAIDEPSKSRAMSVGDSLAKVYPRLYLDADVDLSTESARQMVAALRSASCVVASPEYRLEGCSRLAASYWRAWQHRNPTPRAGTGCFGLDEHARRSFGDFPELLGDDLWIASTFKPEVVSGAVTQVRVARTVRAILRRRIRIARGNREVEYSRSRNPGNRPEPAQALPVKGQQPIGLAVLAGVHSAASAWARLNRSGDWSQDESSRRDVGIGSSPG